METMVYEYMNTRCEWKILRIFVWFGRGNDWCTQSPDYFFDWRSVAGLCIRLYTWLLLTLLYTSLSVSLSFTGIGFFTYMRASMHTNIYIYISISMWCFCPWSLFLKNDISCYHWLLYIDWLVQERRNPIANALKLRLCTNQWIWV